MQGSPERLDGSGQSSAYRIYPFAICAVAWILVENGRRIFGLLAGVYRAQGFTDTQLGALSPASSFGLIFLIGIPIGILIDNISRRIALIVISLTMGVAAVLQFVFFNFPAMLYGALAGAICTAALVPLGVSLIGDIFPARKRPWAIGFLLALPILCTKTMLTLAGLVLSTDNPEQLYLFTASAWVVVFLAAATSVRESGRATDVATTVTTESLSIGGTVLLAATVAFVAMVSVGISNFTAVFLMRRGSALVEVSQVMSRITPSFVALGYVIGASIGAGVALTRMRFVAFAMAGVIAAMIVAIHMGVSAVGLRDAVIFLVFAQSCGGACLAIAIVMICMAGPPSVRARMAAIVVSGYALGPMIGAMIVGLRSDYYRPTLQDLSLGQAMMDSSWVALLAVIPLSIFFVLQRNRASQ